MTNPDIPRFVLKADDPDAPAALRTLCKKRTMRIMRGELPVNKMTKVKELLELADQMEAWYKAQPA